MQVLASLSLDLCRGERVAVVGARGSGKTTLLHCLTGLRRPDSGFVRWDASRGTPYRLCATPAELALVRHHEALLLELPDDPYLVAEWAEALRERRVPGESWLVLMRRGAALAALASRVLHLRDGVLSPMARPLERAGRVAERGEAARSVAGR